MNIGQWLKATSLKGCSAKEQARRAAERDLVLKRMGTTLNTIQVGLCRRKYGVNRGFSLAFIRRFEAATADQRAKVRVVDELKAG